MPVTVLRACSACSECFNAVRKEALTLSLRHLRHREVKQHVQVGGGARLEGILMGLENHVPFLPSHALLANSNSFY